MKTVCDGPGSFWRGHGVASTLIAGIAVVVGCSSQASSGSGADESGTGGEGVAGGSDVGGQSTARSNAGAAGEPKLGVGGAGGFERGGSDAPGGDAAGGATAEGGAETAGQAGAPVGPMPPAGEVGAGCDAPEECASGVCVRDVDSLGDPSGWLGGYCTLDCTPLPHSCPTGSACFTLGDAGQLAACLASCANSAACRQGYVCDEGACIPRCDAPGSGCVEGATCTDSGICAPAPKTCSNYGQSFQPGERRCVDLKTWTQCAEDGTWAPAVACTSSACVDGVCVGDCTPGAVTCSGVVATSCGADGQWLSKSCDYGCVSDPELAKEWFNGPAGCAPSMNTCVYECSGPLYLGCNCCIAPRELVCDHTDKPFQSPGPPRPCTLDDDCGTLGFCNAEDGGSVCRLRAK